MTLSSIRRLPRGPLAVCVACAVFAAAVVLCGCGKKGSPLAPLVKVPVSVDPLTVRRVGAVAYLQFRIPTVNTDATAPADLQRIEIYALTGVPAGREDVFTNGTLIASIPVRKPPEEEPTPAGAAGGTGPQGRPGAETGRRGDASPPKKPPPPKKSTPPRPPASMENGFDQGDTVTVTETIGPAQLAVARVTPAKKPIVPDEQPELPVASPFAPVLVPLLLPPPDARLPLRHYVAVGLNHKRQKGTASVMQAVWLGDPAPAPSTLTTTYTEEAITVTWTPPPGLPQFVQAPHRSGVLASTLRGVRSTGSAFNVYEVPPPAAAPGVGRALAAALAGGLMPTPLNDRPVDRSPLVDRRIAFGTARCYAVRTVVLTGVFAVEGEASPPACLTPIDTFPPAPPTSLQAVGSDAAVSLIWNANAEGDLAGYVVMRADVPNGPWRALTPQPVKETTYRDAAVVRGVRYAYTVVAVDTAKNRSAPSNRVEEAPR